LSTLIKRAVRGVVIGLVVGLILGYSFGQMNTSTLERKIERLEKQVSDLQTQLESKNTQISEMQKQISALKSQMEKSQNLTQPLNLIKNGDFETGDMRCWIVEGANEQWHGNPSSDPIDVFEGEYGIYINPADHGDISIYQDVELSTANFILTFAVKPHTGEYERIVVVTAIDDSGNFVMDSKGKVIELMYVLTGKPKTSGYSLSLDVLLAGYGGKGEYAYFIRNFTMDYKSAGGESSDWGKANKIRIKFITMNGSGGTNWDSFSLWVGGFPSVEAESFTSEISESSMSPELSIFEEKIRKEVDNIFLRNLSSVSVTPYNSGFKIKITYGPQRLWKSAKEYLKTTSFSAVENFDRFFTKYDNVTSVVVNSLTVFLDKYGNKIIKTGVMIRIDRETAEKINWNNFKGLILNNWKHLYDVADEFWIHPIILLDL